MSILMQKHNKRLVFALDRRCNMAPAAQELIELVDEFKEVIIEHLNSIYSMCEKALENNENILVYCD